MNHHRHHLRYWMESSGEEGGVGGGKGGGGGIAGLIRRAFFLSFFVCLSSRSSQGQTLPCTDDTDEPLPFLKAVLLSQVILYGKILRKYPDSRYHHHDVYTAEMEVYCAIKGGQTLRYLNITDAGLLPGLCFSTYLNPMSKYVLLAEFDGTRYRPVDTEQTGTDSTLEEVARACGIDPKYPVGVDPATAEFRCPIPAPPGECVDINYFTTTTTTTVATTPEDNYEVYEDFTDDPIPVEDDPFPEALSPGSSSKSPHLTTIPVDLDPLPGDLSPGAFSKSPHLTTSIFSTSVADFRLIPSVRLLAILVLNLLHQVLGPHLSD